MFEELWKNDDNNNSINEILCVKENNNTSNEIILIKCGFNYRRNIDNYCERCE